ncbi:pollen-specific leucine-rich repeat extensin-like protein 3 [Iris pallida]|uniref:Pollen-specific leucine-rich repeat extensin-like protein 3 n=1 Tax=Iris pallida TaxID=29817 RepID=A0AAX6DVG4_IRIPA|nr:pollen-specific leucine-rich repeat extensin-like protein 3 [Iris pallida]
MRRRPAARGRTRHPAALVAQRGRAVARHRPAAVRKFARQQQLRFERAHAGATAAVAVGDDPPYAGRTLRRLSLAANVLRDAPSRRFVRFERDPVVTRAF